VAPFGTTSEHAISNELSCLAYGIPYLSSGFSLLSLVSTKPFDISSAVFNNDMLNATSVMVIISMACGYAVYLLERKNAHLGTAPRGIYWCAVEALLARRRPRPRPRQPRTLQRTHFCADATAFGSPLRGPGPS
jgi:hypothetical protein